MTVVSRRDALLALGGSAAVAASGGAGAAEASPAGVRDTTGPAAAAAKTYVLVHGTWHGGWVWQRVAERLRAQGHRVYTPTCTGCGERVHLSSPDVGLDTHVTDVANVIEFEELDRVILVGHSFAGLTITGVADRLRERIRRIVFFDALVPTATRNAAVLPGPDGRYPEWWEKRRAQFVDGYRMVFWDHYPIDMLVPASDVENVALLKRRLTTHPMRQWTDRLELGNGGWEGLPRTYFQPTKQAHSPSSEAMWGPAKAPGWDFVQLPVSREAMLTHPQELTAALAALT
ncbi:MAG: alpha/beta fold hydrolase [Steroidobacteraceae bacterium]|nr:alpha/beta fold hydrolase [Steroidobacteraceae bacterium]